MEYVPNISIEEDKPMQPENFTTKLEDDAGNGCLNILEWAEKNNYKMDYEKIFRNAAKNGHLNILE